MVVKCASVIMVFQRGPRNGSRRITIQEDYIPSASQAKPCYFPAEPSASLVCIATIFFRDMGYARFGSGQLQCVPGAPYRPPSYKEPQAAYHDDQHPKGGEQFPYKSHAQYVHRFRAGRLVLLNDNQQTCLDR